MKLSTNGLTGTIPSTFGNLTSLTTMDLSGNHFEGEIPSTFGSLTALVNLALYSNKLAGPVPTSFVNLVNLSPSETAIGYNALYSADEALTTFLNSKDADWAATQTVAPTQVTAASLDNAIIMVSWLPIAYTNHTGGYKVYISETSGGPYTLAGQTVDKTVAALNVTGLTPGDRYYFVVTTQTDAHVSNTNAIESARSAEVTAVASTQVVHITGTITAGGSPLPNVLMSGLTDSPVTNASGVYTGAEAVGWSGTVTPVLAGYTFVPPSVTYTDVISNQTAQNYTATLSTYTISGTVTPARAGVVMNGLPGSPVTAADGTYTATVSYGFDGTATPTLAGYTFVPATRTYADVVANQTTQDYTASVLTYTLTYTAGANGSITGITPQTVAHGASGTEVTAVPNVGYHFVDWSDASTVNPRTDTNVTANLSVTANFAITTYTLTYTAGANGSITGTYASDGRPRRDPAPRSRRSPIPATTSSPGPTAS